MLVLSRKCNQRIFIGPDVVITVTSIYGNEVRLGIDAPEDVKILREELMDRPDRRWGEEVRP